MFTRDRIEQLMAEVGPIADLSVVDAYPSEDMWHVAVDEDVAVFLEMSPVRHVLVLSSELGKPAAGDLKALYELFMRYAYTWEAGGGLRMSLDAPEGQVWVLMDCAAQEFSAGELGHTLRAFANKVRAWREIVAAHGQVLAAPSGSESLLEASMRA